MSETPRRAHVLKIEFGANTLDDLIYQLQQTAIDLRMGKISSRGCIGSPSCCLLYEYSVDESWTKERYFAAIEKALEKDRSSLPGGEG